MKYNRKPVTWGLFAALLLGSTYSSALTLGRVRGAALLGKPLDLSVPVQYAAEEDVSSACFEATVDYGETPLESSRVTVSVLPGAQPLSQWVRVTSSASVDEPLVRLTLRVVCNSKASRRYTLLTDVASELADAGVVASVVPRPDAGDRTASTHAGAGALAAAQAAPAAAVVADTQGRAAATPAQPRKTNATPKPATPVAHAGSTSSSKASPSNVAALEDLQRRVDDIAKWQASSSADGVQKSEARVKALELDIRGLQVVTAKNQKNIQMVATALESNESPNFGRPLVFGLGALLLGCIAALAYAARWMRAGGFASPPWWSAEPERPQATAFSGAPLRATAPGALSSANSLPGALGEPHERGRGNPSEDNAAALGTRNGDTDSGTLSMGVNAASAASPTAQRSVGPDRSARPDFTPSAHGHLKSINTREMLDVRQQAEFFMALGQHDEAVRLLESSIQGSADCNPLMLLDLLKILHTLSRRADFERYREEFNAQFTGRIPPYADFLSEGNGLDAYEDICNQIVVLWPTDYTIDYIEQCLVRLPEDDPEQGMDLEAFKDLLLLYGVLKRLDQSYDSNLAPFSASRSEPPQSTTLSAVQTVPTQVVPVAGDGVVATPVDIDLGLNPDEVDGSVSQGQHDNLIDFDMSDYIARKKAEAAK